MKIQVVEREAQRGVYMGSFDGPRFDQQGRRLSTGIVGKPARLYNNRMVRANWKERGSTVLPTPTIVPSPSPERLEENVGEGTRGRGSTVGVPCESQVSYRPCKRKAFALGPKKVRLCVPCLKAVWNRQGYCPLRLVVLR